MIKQPYVRSLVLSVAMTALASAAVADTTHGKRYVGASVTFPDYELRSESAALTGLQGRVGGFLNEYMAFEGRAEIGVIGDTIANRDVDLSYSFGPYIRAGLPLDKVFPYLIVGFTRAVVDLGSPSISDAETDSSYGVGADFEVLNLTISLEYMQLIDKNNMDLSGFSFGFTSTF
jgi:hypothetical protein